jgi:pimeloyl-ACP methyl ester carboxylesterase
MIKHYFLAAAAVLLLVIASPARSSAQQVPSAVTSDPAPDKAHPPTTAVPDIPSHGAKLYTVIYLAAGEGPHPTVLLMHGFPGNEQNMDLAQSIRRAGWNVVAPHYRGSWGSGGNFSFWNSIEDTQAVLQFVREPENLKKYSIDPKKIVIIGHSMGGFMSAYAGSHDPGVAAVGLISAWNIGATATRTAKMSADPDFREEASRLAGTTPEALDAEAHKSASQWNFVDYAPMLKDRPVLVLESDDGLTADDKAMADALRKAGDSRVTETYIATDHVYSGQRIALQAAVVNWLETLR